jgi:hypothetical protein
LPPEGVIGRGARHTVRCRHLKVLRARSPFGAPPRLSSQGERWRLGPGRASRDQEGSGVTRTIDRA